MKFFSVEGDENATRKQIRDRLIGQIQNSLSNVFPDLQLIGTGHPLKNGTFFFEKGISSDWRYKNLSGGEKAAFDLLLDLVVKRESFSNTVYCIDEPEIHMHTKLQSALLKELYKLIPDKCQLWISTHSIGMMREAQRLKQSEPNSVVFLNFNDIEPDRQSILKPSKTDRNFWKQVFSVALDELSELVAPKQIIFCEGHIDSSKQFDAKCYRQIFRDTHPDTEFISLGGSTEIEKNASLAMYTVNELFSQVRMWKLIDRDDRSHQEIEDAKNNEVKVLSRRTIESYLLDDEILKKFAIQLDDGHTSQNFELISSIKQNALSNSVSRQNPPDNLKLMAGEFYTEMRRHFNLTQYGSTVEVFCRDTLAPLVTPDTTVFQQLEHDIFSQ